jgi:hypothetical protein
MYPARGCSGPLLTPVPGVMEGGRQEYKTRNYPDEKYKKIVKVIILSNFHARDVHTDRISLFFVWILRNFTGGFTGAVIFLC